MAHYKRENEYGYSQEKSGTGTDFARKTDYKREEQ